MVASVEPVVATAVEPPVIRTIGPLAVTAVESPPVPIVEPSVVAGVKPAVAAVAEPLVAPPVVEISQVVDQRAIRPIALDQRVENELPKRSDVVPRDARGIHEAALATAFGDISRNAATRPTNRASAWSALMTPQAAIVAGLLAIAGAVIVGLGTGLAAKDMIEIPAPLKEEAAAPQGFAGDFTTVE
jgi:hypothetical protein